MTASNTQRMPLTTLDDDAWDDLLSFIEEHRVIPIAGPDLLVDTDAGPRLLLDCLAEKFAAGNHGDEFLPVEFTCPRYAQALTDKAQAPAPLREAMAIIDSVVPTVRAVHDVRQWRERISAGGPSR